MEIVIANADIARVPADLLVLKHADGFYGADDAVARAIGFSEHIERGQARFCRTTRLTAPEVLFIGVGPLSDFRYERIQEFGAQTIKLARQHNRAVGHIALTIHGPGYGLDPEESFCSMIAGVIAEWKQAEGTLRRVTVAERSERRCELLNKVLLDHLEEFGLSKNRQSATVEITSANPAIPAAAGTNIVHLERDLGQPNCSWLCPESIDEFEMLAEKPRRGERL